MSKRLIPKQENAQIESGIQLRDSDPNSPVENQLWLNDSDELLIQKSSNSIELSNTRAEGATNEQVIETFDTIFEENPYKYTNTVGGAGNNLVIDAAVQSDGKIILVGSFTSFGGNTRNYIVRLNSDGSEDTVFYAAITAGGAFNSDINCVRIQSDGKIILGGAFTTYKGVTRNRLVRLNVDGSEDTAFYTSLGAGGVNGAIIGEGRGIQIQPDGKIIICGAFTAVGVSIANRIARLNSDGSPDTSFNTNLGLGANTNVYCAELQPDGKILVGGLFTTFNTAARNYMVRLNSDGTEDVTFYENLGKNVAIGSSSTAFNNTVDFIKYYDQKILIGGAFTTLNGATHNRFLRVNLDGTLDRDFDNNIGSSSSGIGFNMDIYGEENSILLSTHTGTTFNGNTTNRIVALNWDGTVNNKLQQAFGSGFNGTVHRILTNGQNVIMTGGFTTVNGITKNRLAFFENVAGPSIRWNDGDIFKYDFKPYETSQNINFDIYKIEEDEKFYANVRAAFNGVINHGAKQSDGKIILGGDFTTFNGLTRNRLIRLNADGAEDIDFSVNIGTGAAATVRYIKIQPDGKILICGSFTTFNGATRNRVVRLNSNGTLDATFATNVGTAAGDIVYQAATQTVNGQLKIVLIGAFTTFNAITRNRMVRLNEDGTVDADFYTNLRGGFGAAVYGLEILDDNKIATCGIFTTTSSAPRNRIAIIRPDGYDDGSFTEIASDGTRYAAGRVWQTLTQPDGKVIVCGDFTYEGVVGRSYLIRLNADGTLDRTFVANATDTSKFNALIYRVALQSNGQILVCGNFTNYAGTTGRNRLIRLNANGTIDATFCANASDGAKFGAAVWDVHVQPNGNILAVGEFTAYAGTVGRSYVVRLDSNGTVDNAFCTAAVDGTKFNAICNSVVSNSSNEIFIGGNYTAYAGTANRNRLVKLDNNGALDVTFTANASDAAKFGAGIFRVFLQANGQVLAGGDFLSYGGTANRNRLVRLNSDGSTDTAFCTAAVDGTKFNSSVYSIAEHTDGKLVIGGNFTGYAGTANRNYLIRLNSSGTTDTTFCTNASDGAKIAGATPSAEVRAVEVQSDGKVIFSGAFSAYAGVSTRDKVIRVNNDGTQELSFNRRLVVASTQATHGFSGATEVWKVVKDQYGLIVTGDFVLFNGNTRNRMVRIGFDGTEDTTFYSRLGLGFNAYVYEVSVNSKGQIFVPGNFTQFNNKITNRIVVLNPDGTEDYKYNAAFRQRSEVDWIPVSRNISGVLALAVTPESDNLSTYILVDGSDMYVLGNFTRFDSLPRNRITKYTQRVDGSIDFNTENAVNWQLHDGNGMLSTYPTFLNHGIVCDKKGNWIISCGGHMWRSLNNGIQWELSDREDLTWREVDTDEKGLWISVTDGAATGRIIKSTDNGTTWVYQGSIENNTWFSIATDKKGTWIAVATTGTNRIVRSTDNGATWAVQPSPSTAALYNVKTDRKGTWIAIANSGTNRIIRSTNNGVSWQVVSIPEDGNNWSGLSTDCNGNWIATATTGTNRIMVSSDNGETWTAQKMFNNEWTLATAAELNDWNSIVYENNTFVAVASTGANRVMTSPDGVTWTARLAELNSWRSVTYGNNTFVAVAGTGTNRVMTSSDGTTWTPQTAAQANFWTSITYGNNTFVAVSSDGTNRVMTSSDGVTWTARTAAQANPWVSVTFGRDLFVAVSVTGTNRVMTSPDGITWTVRTAAAANTWESVTYGDGLFVAVSSDGANRVMTSPDGITWTARTAAEANSWRSVTYGNKLFVATSINGTNRVMTSPDGITWYAVAAAEVSTWNDVVYGDSKFVAISYSGTSRVMTIDGDDLVALPNNNNEWNSITTDEKGLWVAVASDGSRRIVTSSDDGYTWEDIEAPAQNDWFKIATDGNGTWIAIANTNVTYRVIISSTVNRESPENKTISILVNGNEFETQLYSQTIVSE